MDTKTLSQKIQAACTIAPAIITVAYCDAKIASASRSVDNARNSAQVERGLNNILLWTATKRKLMV